MLSLRIGKRTLGSVAVRAAALHSEAAKAAAETGSFKDQMIFKPRCKGTRTPSAAAVELSNRCVPCKSVMLHLQRQSP